jgi:hypothetical protein
LPTPRKEALSFLKKRNKKLLSVCCGSATAMARQAPGACLTDKSFCFFFQKEALAF